MQRRAKRSCQWRRWWRPRWSSFLEQCQFGDGECKCQRKWASDEEKAQIQCREVSRGQFWILWISGLAFKAPFFFSWPIKSCFSQSFLGLFASAINWHRRSTSIYYNFYYWQWWKSCKSTCWSWWWPNFKHNKWLCYWLWCWWNEN